MKGLTELAKYLPMLLKYAAYLKYIPFLFTLVGLVKEAERKFREANSGAQKLAWAREQFAAIVNAIEASGLITAKLAKALRDGAEAIISVVVQVMNAVQGGVITDPPDEGESAEDKFYAQTFHGPVSPDDSLIALKFKAGDEVMVNRMTEGGEASAQEWGVSRPGIMDHPVPPFRRHHIIGA